MKREQPLTTDRDYTYTVVIEAAEEGGYVVTCPSLRGVVTQGETLDEACAIAADAIEGYLELLREDDLPIPPSDKPTREPGREQVAVRLQGA